MQQPITPNLWFDTEAEEAAEFYVSVFKNSRVVNLTRMRKLDVAALQAAADGAAAS
jgi:predicted 3-demethylubiquinone-9 3-methyltransferase (glyoxalase superfamily)